MTADAGRLAAYVASLFAREDAALAAARAGHRRADLPEIFVSAEEGTILHLLLRMVGARRVLEVGTLGGYSGIWLVRALPPNGRLVTIEGDEGHAAVAREAFDRAGVADRVDLRVGEARDTLATLEGPFDAVFLDADKGGQMDYFKKLYPKKLAPGGMIAVHNAVSEAGDMKDYMDMIRRHPDFDTVIVSTTMADGICLSYRHRAA